MPTLSLLNQFFPKTSPFHQTLMNSKIIRSTWTTATASTTLSPSDERDLIGGMEEKRESQLQGLFPQEVVGQLSRLLNGGISSEQVVSELSEDEKKYKWSCTYKKQWKCSKHQDPKTYFHPVETEVNDREVATALATAELLIEGSSEPMFIPVNVRCSKPMLIILPWPFR